MNISTLQSAFSLKFSDAVKLANCFDWSVKKVIAAGVRIHGGAVIDQALCEGVEYDEMVWTTIAELRNINAPAPAQ